MDQLWDFIAPIQFLIPIFLAGAIATYLEWQFPRRDDPVTLGRWYKSVMLFALTVPLLAVVMPVVGYALAVWSEAVGSGILPFDGLPLWLRIVTTVLILDFLNFISHFVMHRFNLFWRVHRVHHSDRMVSASTSLLHHPVEQLLLNIAGLISIPFLGLQGEGLLIYGFLQFVIGVWHHSNVENVPGQYAVGKIIFTPDLHRIHHSIDKAHHTANLGLVFTFWDRLFGSYIGERDLDKKITYGLPRDEWDHPDTVRSLLIDPFRK